MQDCCSTSGLMTLAQAQQQLLAAITPSEKTVTCPLADAYGQVLSQDVCSPIAVPCFDNSAMDGYALNSADQQPTYEVIGQSLAGHPFDGELKTGQAVRIMTGAPMPAGADSVVMQEHVQRDGNHIRLERALAAGNNVRHRGEEIAQGDKVLPRGTRLDERHIGLLATLGLSTVAVSKPITVALLSTGDELKAPGQPLQVGEIYDSNRIMLRAALLHAGCKVIDFGIIADHPQQIRQALLSAAQQADAIITSGGVSVGDADYVKQQLEELGSIAFWKVAIKPGKPFAYGHINHKQFFGLPGNPVSAMLCFRQLVLPALDKLASSQIRQPLRLQATTTTALKKVPGRIDFQRGVYQQQNDGSLVVASAGGQSSSMLSTLAQANCFIVLEQERGNVAAGETVTIELW